MSRYVIRRIIQAIPLLVATSILVFAILELAPGDPTQMYMDPDKATDPEYLAQVRESLGLNEPVYVRYGAWLSKTLQGDLGFSFRTRRAVTFEMGERLPNTLLLGGVALLISIIIALPIGIISALKRYTLLDYALSTLALVGISVPVFWIALLLLQVFSIQLGWLPAVGMHDMREEYTGWANVVDVLKHMILPATVLSLAQTASWSRYQRSALLEVLDQDYIRTARAKGLRERRVIIRHALRNALIPIVTLIGLSVPSIVTGAFITETIFGWPGMGRLGVEAIDGRDYPIIMAVTMLSSLVIILGNLLADIAYVWVDPRIRYE
ncbi:MAG TPA: ABC transporter permease [Aggregatilinea sp.]|jgi:peptide/nickel transport system permease protein|uniref:ABC transporter permease n=1 Tax=Aggregatilinea sp. TaxID=2806333 RepID=UPI002CD18FC2|nr:ABC transporter permease [Aggregatilinea sp.]HML23271.1 ABC transporter permease [Aggregatilinea sp.]